MRRRQALGRLREIIRKSQRNWLLGCVLSTAAIALTVLVLQLLRLNLGLINVALCLLLVSVMSAAAWGWIVGIYCSILSNLAFNFFFVPPLYQFTVEKPENVLALVLFLLVAAITASLFAQIRRSAREADRRAQETQTLLALSRTIRDQPLERLPVSICERIVSDFGVQSCTLYRLDGEELEPVAHAGDLDASLSRDERSVALQAARSVRSTGLGYRLPRVLRRSPRPGSPAGQLYLPLRLENTPIGVLRIQMAGSPLYGGQEGLLEAFADETAAILHRTSLAESARSAALLQETDRLKSALLSSVSHDLRTPLTAIKASAANLMSTEVQWSEAARQEFLSAIDREADRLTHLVANLLDLSRIEAGALRLDLDWNDLDELVRNAVYRAEQAAPERRFVLDLKADLPLLRFDYLQVDRVVANLLDNATKYSPPDGQIEVGTHVDVDRLSVSVCDHGGGIPASQRQRVFDPFYRSERGKGAAGGSGLGLAICRGIVEAHGGKIWVEGDEGAILTFTLPRDPVGEPAPIPEPSPVAGSAS